MTKIKAPAKQRACRPRTRGWRPYQQSPVTGVRTSSLPWLVSVPAVSRGWCHHKSCLAKKLRRSNGVYNEAIKVYLLKEKLVKERAGLLTKNLVRNSFKDHPSTYTPIGASGTVTQTITTAATQVVTGLATVQRSRNTDNHQSAPA